MKKLEFYKRVREGLLDLKNEDACASFCHAMAYAELSKDIDTQEERSRFVRNLYATGTNKYMIVYHPISRNLKSEIGVYPELEAYRPDLGMTYWFGCSDFKTRFDILDKIITQLENDES